MMLTLVVPLLVAAADAPAVSQRDDPAVRIWLNRDGYFFPGDKARVTVRPAQDGYLVVLRADAAGRVRVLFPLEPGDDARVRGGRRIEVRGRGDREAFRVDELDGTGLVLAAWSSTPLKFDDFMRNNHWDYRALAAGDTAGAADPEQALLEVAHRMAAGGSFDYDVAEYTVEGSHAYRRGWGYPRHSRVRVSVGFGWGRPYYGYAYGSCFDAFWYDPFFCRSYYAPFYYRGYRGAIYRPYLYRGGVFGGRSGGGLRFKIRGGAGGGIGPRFRAPEGVLRRGRSR